MNLLLTAGLMLASMAAPAEVEGQNTPPKEDAEAQCVPNRSPQQRGARRDGRRPTVQCNLVRNDRERDDRRFRGMDDKPNAPVYASFDRSAGSPQ